MSKNNTERHIEFGDVPPSVDEILQQGVSLYRQDRAAADARFQDAIALDPTVLPSYQCLYKIYTYQGRLDEAYRIALAGLEEAARQAGLSADWQQWTRAQLCSASDQPSRFALYTLKALSFIHLKRNELAESRRILTKLEDLGQLEDVGGSVVTDLADALEA